MWPNKLKYLNVFKNLSWLIIATYRPWNTESDLHTQLKFEMAMKFEMGHDHEYFCKMECQILSYLDGKHSTFWWFLLSLFFFFEENIYLFLFFYLRILKRYLFKKKEKERYKGYLELILKYQKFEILYQYPSSSSPPPTQLNKFIVLIFYFQIYIFNFLNPAWTSRKFPRTGNFLIPDIPHPRSLKKLPVPAQPSGNHSYLF